MTRGPGLVPFHPDGPPTTFPFNQIVFSTASSVDRNLLDFAVLLIWDSRDPSETGTRSTRQIIEARNSLSEYLEDYR